MIVTLLASSLVFLETAPPPAPVATELTEQANRLRHVETDDDPSGVDAQTMQEQAREERDANADRQTQSSDNETDEPRQRRRQDGQGLRPARRPNPGD